MAETEKTDDQNIAAESGQEYDLMLTLEDLESLEEELEEVGFSTLGEVETAIGITSPDEKNERRAVLLEIRDRMLDLDVTNLREIRAFITQLNEQLDAKEQG